MEMGNEMEGEKEKEGGMSGSRGCGVGEDWNGLGCNGVDGERKWEGGGGEEMEGGVVLLDEQRIGDLLYAVKEISHQEGR